MIVLFNYESMTCEMKKMSNNVYFSNFRKNRVLASSEGES